MLYSCTHMTNVDVKGLNLYDKTIKQHWSLCSNEQTCIAYGWVDGGEENMCSVMIALTNQKQKH